jgi:hypothetical protein
MRAHPREPRNHKVTKDRPRGHRREAFHVHYRSAIDTGPEMGRKVAAYMIDNALKPAR